MIAKELKPGQWFRLAGCDAVLLCTRIAMERVHYSTCSESYNAAADCLVIPLPDCTGYDWVPPAKPKRYRPFASAEEFEPHRDRWVRTKAVKDVGFRVSGRNGCGVYHVACANGWESWSDAYRSREFEDGTPFGVEVQNAN